MKILKEWVDRLFGRWSSNASSPGSLPWISKLWKNVYAFLIQLTVSDGCVCTELCDCMCADFHIVSSFRWTVWGLGERKGCIPRQRTSTFLNWNSSLGICNSTCWFPSHHAVFTSSFVSLHPGKILLILNAPFTPQRIRVWCHEPGEEGRDGADTDSGNSGCPLLNLPL